MSQTRTNITSPSASLSENARDHKHSDTSSTHLLAERLNEDDDITASTPRQISSNQDNKDVNSELSSTFSLVSADTKHTPNASHNKNIEPPINSPLGATIASYPLPELKGYGKPIEFLMTQNGILLTYKNETESETTKKYKVGFIREFSKEYKDFPVLDFYCKTYSKLNLIKIKDGRDFACLATIDSNTIQDLICEFYEIDNSNTDQLNKKLVKSYTHKFNTSPVFVHIFETEVASTEFIALPNGESVTCSSMSERRIVNLLTGAIEDLPSSTKYDRQHPLLNGNGIVVSSKQEKHQPPIYINGKKYYPAHRIGVAERIFCEIYILKNNKSTLQWEQNFENPGELSDRLSSNIVMSPHKDWFAISVNVFNKNLLKIFHSPPKLSTPIACRVIVESSTPPMRVFSLLWLPDNSGLLYIDNNDKCYYVDIRNPAKINPIFIANATTVQFDLDGKLLITYKGQVNCYEFFHLAKTRKLLIENEYNIFPETIRVKDIIKIINQYAGEENSILHYLNFFNPSAMFIFSTRLSTDLNTEMKKLYSEYSTQIIESANKNAIYESNAIVYFYTCISDSSKTIAQCVRKTIAEYPDIAEGFISKPLKKLFDEILGSDKTHANHSVLFPPLSITMASASDNTINKDFFIGLMIKLKTRIEINLKNSDNIDLRVLKQGIESILAKAVEYKSKKVLYKSTINTMLSKILNSINLIQDKSLKLELKEYLNEFKQPLASPNLTITTHAKK